MVTNCDCHQMNELRDLKSNPFVADRKHALLEVTRPEFQRDNHS